MLSEPEGTIDFIVIIFVVGGVSIGYAYGVKQIDAAQMYHHKRGLLQNNVGSNSKKKA